MQSENPVHLTLCPANYNCYSMTGFFKNCPNAKECLDIGIYDKQGCFLESRLRYLLNIGVLDDSFKNALMQNIKLSPNFIEYIEFLKELA